MENIHLLDPQSLSPVFKKPLQVPPVLNQSFVVWGGTGQCGTSPRSKWMLWHRPSYCCCVHPLLPCPQHKNITSQTPEKMSYSTNRNSKQIWHQESVSKLKVFQWNMQHKQKWTKNLTQQLPWDASSHISIPKYVGTWSLSHIDEIVSSRSTGATRRAQQCVFKNGCYGSGTIAATLSCCRNVNSRNAARSCSSMSQPAGFLQLFRMAAIHLLSLPWNKVPWKPPVASSLPAFPSCHPSDFPFLLCLAHHSLLFQHVGTGLPLISFFWGLSYHSISSSTRDALFSFSSLLLSQHRVLGLQITTCKGE